MTVSDRTRVALLITLRTGLDEDVPLDAGEWSALTRWLADRDHAPEDLIAPGGHALLDAWTHRRIEPERLRRLLERDHLVMPLLDRWSELGLWVLGRSDAGYPQRLRQRLGESAPPVLFGAGNDDLFARRGLALVGSRNAGADDARLAVDLAQRAVREGFGVISGGARGIDTHAEQAALGAGGGVISVLADSLVRTARHPRYRGYLGERQLALITPFSPEAGFSSGNAMGRNRLIYCLADAAVAVCSTLHEGGTFRGAKQVIEKRWVPVWVPRSNEPGSGNNELIRLGARELTEVEGRSVASLTEPSGETRPVSVQPSLFGGCGCS